MKNKPIFISLGRAGDLLNSLPLAWRYWKQTGEKPYFMTARAYADLLEGVSYVEPVIYEGEFTMGVMALYEARKLTEDIRLCQIYGFGINPGELCTSFARQSWVQAGADVPWGSLPLVIDQRNAAREQELLQRYVWPKQGKKLVLVALKGQSSPFPFAGLVMKELEERFSESDGYQVLNISDIKAWRFYDLLGLFDHAECLVTIDTGHLHLAHASNIPVVAFVTRDPSPWHGSPWRPEHVGRFYYDEVPGMINEIMDSVASACFARANSSLIRMVQPKIIHTWSDWREGEASPELKRRCSVAQQSWVNEYATGYWHPAEHKRTPETRTGENIGDPHPIGYVHDTIENGVQFATKDSDIICLSNSDIGFTPGLTGHILEIVLRKGAAYSHRRDFDRIDNPFISEAHVRTGKWYPGTDLFCFSVGWWKQHKHEYGDYLLGRAHWDEVLRQLIKYHGGGNLKDSCWHEWHPSFWCAEQRWSLPGNVRNDGLRKLWFAQTGFVPEDFRYFATDKEGSTHAPTPPEKPYRLAK